MKIRRLGIVAGSGTLSAEAVKEAQTRGLEFCFYLISEENPVMLPRWQKETPGLLAPPKIISLGKFDLFLKQLEKDGISDVIIAGKIHKDRIFKGMNFNLKTLSLLKKVKNFSDKSIFNLIAEELRERSIRILPQEKFFRNLVLETGVYTRRKPKKEDLKNIDFGMGYARKVAALDIGQSVVLSGSLLVAVEAIEGTDEAIRRSAGYIRNGKGIVCKAMQKKQDTRFDVASVGPGTIESMKEAGCFLLAIEANRTFVLEKEKFLDLANRYGMVVVSCQEKNGQKHVLPES